MLFKPQFNFFAKWQLFLPLLIIPFLISIPAELEKMRAVRAVGSAFHILLPYFLTLLLFKKGRFAGSIYKAGAIAFIVIALCEPLQIFVGRHPRYQDVLVDLSGVLIAVFYTQWKFYRSKKWLITMLIPMLSIPWMTWRIPGFIIAEINGEKNFPQLGNFEENRWVSLWDSNNSADNSFVSFSEEDGNRYISCTGHPEDYYPGISAIGLPRDWSQYRYLTFDARTINGSVELVLELNDYRSRKDEIWIGGAVSVTQQWQQYKVDLLKAKESVQPRNFRMDDIDKVVFYLHNLNNSKTVHLDNIKLTGD